MFWASLISQSVKNPPAVQETPVQFLGWEDPLEKGKATHSSILAWRNPWTVHGLTKSGTRLKDLHFQVMVYVIRFSLRKTKNHVNHVIYIFNREKYKLPVLCTHTYLTSLEWWKTLVWFLCFHKVAESSVVHLFDILNTVKLPNQIFWESNQYLPTLFPVLKGKYLFFIMLYEIKFTLRWDQTVQYICSF